MTSASDLLGTVGRGPKKTMATGIRKLHSRSCRSRHGGRCNCGAGYEAWVYLPRERTKVRKTFAREAEAKSWRADALVAANRGTLRPTRRDARTLAEALGEFVDGMKAGTVRPKNRAGYKPNTIRSYERAVRVYIAGSALGTLKVHEAKRSDVQGLADELLGAGLAPGTVSNVLNPVQAFYRRAMDREELAYNPAARLDLPGLGRRRQTRIASSEEATRLLAALPESDRPIWATAFYAGLRRGELMALRCSDVDLGRSLIRVERSWDQEEGPIDPKSDSSHRTVPLLALLRDYLDEHLLRTSREGDALIFGRSPTLPFAPMALGKRAQKVWGAAGLEPITLHECRHTFASLLIDAGANPKAIQTFMGHSKIQTTFDTYGHLMPGSHDEVRVRMDAYLADQSAGITGSDSDRSPATPR
jgi:integrase